jgi:hypothetical protein
MWSKKPIKTEVARDNGARGKWVYLSRPSDSPHSCIIQAAKLSKEYEKKGGSYENESGSKNEPKKGTPQPKSSSKKKSEEKQSEKKSESPSPDDQKEDEQEPTESEQKPKANSSKKKDQASSDTKKPAAKGAANKGAAAKKDGALKGKGKERTEGTRKSSRISEKRKTDGGEEEKPAKKRKSK